MKKRDFDRWLDFCRRMITSGVLGNLTDLRQQRLLEEAESFIGNYRGRPVRDWDSGEFDCYPCDDFKIQFEGYFGTILLEWGHKEHPHYFINQLETIVRAGLDIAVNYGCGVLGFEVGDLRQMYGGRIPRWITRQYTGMTARSPDDVPIWL